MHTSVDYILLELLKNSMRATVERHKKSLDIDEDYPPIEIHISEDEEYVSIRVSDQGGGIPPAHMDKIWSYFFTTGKLVSNEKVTSNNKWSCRKEDNAPWTGFGYGLPLSRTYCRYFGGDLRITTKEGYGTDVTIYLKHLKNSDERFLDLRW